VRRIRRYVPDHAAKSIYYAYLNDRKINYLDHKPEAQVVEVTDACESTTM